MITNNNNWYPHTIYINTKEILKYDVNNTLSKYFEFQSKIFYGYKLFIILMENIPDLIIHRLN